MRFVMSKRPESEGVRIFYFPTGIQTPFHSNAGEDFENTVSDNPNLLIASLLSTLRDEFHTGLIPAKNVPPRPCDNIIHRAALQRTLSRAETIARMLNHPEPGAVFLIIGTTPKIVEKLHLLFQEACGREESESVRWAQEIHNQSGPKIDDVTTSLTLYLQNQTLPVRPAQRGGFGN